MKYEKVGCNGDWFVVSLYVNDGGLDCLRFYRGQGHPEVTPEMDRFVVAVRAHSLDNAFRQAHDLWKAGRI